MAHPARRVRQLRGKVRVRLGVLLSVLGALALQACDPVDACDKNQRFTVGTCQACPPESTPDGSRCVCNDPDKVIKADACVDPDADMGTGAVGDGGVADGGTGDAAAGGGATSGASCGDYCDFLKVCLGDNAIAAGAAADVIASAGIDGEDTSACETSCAPNAAADGAALACFGDAAGAASCAGDQSFDGVGEALGIIDSCCTVHAESALCTALCAAIAANDVARGLVPACQ